MPPEKTRAFLLRRAAYRESDCIAVLFTRDFGKVGAIARGERKSKVRYGGSGLLRPFCCFEAELAFHRGRDLADLKAVHPAGNFHRHILGSLERLAAGYRMLEMVDAFEHDSQPAPALFDLLEEALAGLDRGSDPRECRLRFEAGLLEAEGLALTVDRCVACGSGGGVDLKILSFSKGGLLCRRCGNSGDGRGRLTLSAASARALTRLFSGAPWVQGNIAADEALEGYVRYQLGRPLKSAAFEKRLATDGNNG